MSIKIIQIRVANQLAEKWPQTVLWEFEISKSRTWGTGFPPMVIVIVMTSQWMVVFQVFRVRPADERKLRWRSLTEQNKALIGVTVIMVIVGLNVIDNDSQLKKTSDGYRPIPPNARVVPKKKTDELLLALPDQKR